MTETEKEYVKALEEQRDYLAEVLAKYTNCTKAEWILSSRNKTKPITTKDNK